MNIQSILLNRNTILADAIGNLDHAIKAQQKELKELKAEFLDADEAIYVGRFYTVKRVDATQTWTLDTKAVKSEMGDAWYDEHCKVGNRCASVRISS